MLQLHPAHPYSFCDGWLTIKLDRDARSKLADAAQSFER